MVLGQYHLAPRHDKRVCRENVAGEKVLSRSENNFLTGLVIRNFHEKVPTGFRPDKSTAVVDAMIVHGKNAEN